jgi:phage terminase large subunit-like protein
LQKPLIIGGKEAFYTKTHTSSDGSKYYYVPELAERAVKFFPDCLRHAKGEWAGTPVELEEWQKERIIRPLFGWVDEAGLRRYRMVWVEIPRKNGKSTLAAGVAIYLEIADNEPGAEVYSCAADKDQAAVVFDVAKQMVEASDFLKSHMVTFKKSIIVPRSASKYVVLSADAFTKHGLNAHGVMFDEFHTQPSRALFDVMITAVGSRRQPVVFIITTSGFDRTSICYEQHQHAMRVAEGIIEDDRLLVVIFSAEKDLEKNPNAWKDEATIKAANPNYGVSLKPDYIAGELKRAIQQPSYENTFKRLQLNIWTEQDVRWMPMDVWDKLAGDTVPTERALRGRRAFGGLDLANTTDLAAFLLLFPPIKRDEVFKILCYFWVPELRATIRKEKNRLPYPEWIKTGLVRATPGDIIDYDIIRRDINKLGDMFDIAEIGYDPWNATQMTTQLEGDGFTMVPVRQGFTSMGAPTKYLMTLALAGDLDHGRNPVLRWMMSNMTVATDAAGLEKPDKSRSSEKIDGIVALINAIARLIATPEKQKSVYEKRGLISV